MSVSVRSVYLRLGRIPGTAVTTLYCCTWYLLYLDQLDRNGSRTARKTEPAWSPLAHHEFTEYHSSSITHHRHRHTHPHTQTHLSASSIIHLSKTAFSLFVCTGSGTIPLLRVRRGSLHCCTPCTYRRTHVVGVISQQHIFGTTGGVEPICTSRGWERHINIIMRMKKRATGGTGRCFPRG